MSINQASDRIPLIETLRILQDARGDAVVVTSMGAARDWGREFPPHPLDFIHAPSSMGQTPAIGLGIALARPARRVVVCVGDGSLLMNLGCLVTIAAARPGNLTLLVFDNDAYEVTGGQPTPAALVGDSGVDLAALACAAGFPVAGRIDTLEDWREQAPTILSQAGPVCTVLKVAADLDGGPVGPLPPARERAVAFTAAIASIASPELE